MKKTLFTLLIINMIPLILSGQDVQDKIHEVGITFSNLDNFGVRYKTGNDNAMLRLTVLSSSGNKYNNERNSEDYTSNGSFGIGLNAGIEKRKPVVADKMDFYYGLDLLMNYNSQNQEYIQIDRSNKNWTISPGVGFVLGLTYRINANLNISAEVVPSVRYSYSKSTDSVNNNESIETSSGFSYGISNSGANLTLAYRFNKKK